MGRVDLPVAVTQCAPARTCHHRGQLHSEDGVELSTVRCGLLRDPRRPVLHTSHPISPVVREHPRRGPFTYPTEVGHIRALPPPYG